MFILILVLQLILGFLMGFAGSWMVNFNELQELAVFVFGASIGIAGVGIISQEVYKNIKFSKQLIFILNTFIGAVFGAFLVILLDSSNKVDDFVIPLLLGVGGYYYTNLMARIWSK